MKLNDPLAGFDQTTSKSGIKVYNLHQKEKAGHWIEILIHSGKKDDPDKLTGLAHFTEHMFLESGPISPRNIRNFISDLGGRSRLGYTGIEITGSNFFAPKEHLSKIFSMLGSSMFNNRLSQERLDLERQIIMSEFRLLFPSMQSYDGIIAVNQVLYPDCFQSLHTDSSIGSPHTINTVSLDDLQQFYNQHYVTNNVSIVGVGGLSTRELVKILDNDQNFGQKTGKANPGLIKKSVAPKPSQSKFHRKANHRRDLAIIFTLPGSINNLLTRVLINQLRNVFNDKMRDEQKKHYKVGVDFINQGDLMEFQITFTDVQPKNQQTLIDDSSKCFQEILSNENSFNMMKANMINLLKLPDYNLSQIRESASADLIINGKIISLKEGIEILQNLQLQDLQRYSSYLNLDHSLIIEEYY